MSNTSPSRFTHRAGQGALIALAAYGAARAVSDWRRSRAAPPNLQAPARAMVDEVIGVAMFDVPTDADHAYYEWRADLLAHADEMQPPVDE